MVVPIHDVNPVRRTPWVTYLLIAVNVFAFLLSPAATTGVAGATLSELCRQEEFYDRYGAIPTELVHNRQLPRAPTGEVGIGPRGPGCVIAEPPTYQKIPFLSVLYSMFLHGGWLHLLGNMLFLWVFGNNVEDRLGRLKYLAFYVIGGYLAAYGFAFANATSTQPLIGASGAVSGVLGAYMVLYPHARVWSLVPVLLFVPLRLPAWLVLGTWFLLQWIYSAGLAVSAAGSVAYLAHVLGFVFGMAVALPLRACRRPPPPPYGPPPYVPDPRW